MSINFATLQGLTIPEGVVKRITDASGRVLWQVRGDGKVVLMVEKITSDTYAGETTYTGEQFVLLDIYPKTNGTVTVTYGGLTKTITDTSGAESPNAQQVFFGTFNGVSDSVATPASGELTIEGDCAAFSLGTYQRMGSKSASTYRCNCIYSIKSFGLISYIPSSAFSSCTGLTSVTIPNSVTSIGSNAFSSCTGLTSVTIRGGSIGDYAFSNCTGLTSVTILSGVVSIAGNPFVGCTTLTEFITTGDNFVSENGVLFSADKTRLISYPTVTGHYDIPNGVTDIASAFSSCTGLTSVTIPNSVTSIGSSAFSSCTGLTSVTIPNSVTSIGSSAFSSCTGLTSVTIPNSVTSIGSSAFSSCIFTSLSIPEGVTSIGKYAFQWALQGVGSFTIPSTVEEVGEGSFGIFSPAGSDETISAEVTVLPTTPPAMIENSYAESYGYALFGNKTYVGAEDTLTIIVPKGTLGAYKSAKGWGDWSAYMKEAT